MVVEMKNVAIIVVYVYIIIKHVVRKVKEKKLVEVVKGKEIIREIIDSIGLDNTFI